MSYDPELAVDIANRINEIMRDLPPGTQPMTVLAGLSAVVARLISTLRPEDREGAIEYLMTTVWEEGGGGPMN